MGKSHREQIGTEHCEMELVGRVKMMHFLLKKSLLRVRKE